MNNSFDWTTAPSYDININCATMNSIKKLINVPCDGQAKIICQKLSQFVKKLVNVDSDPGKNYGMWPPTIKY